MSEGPAKRRSIASEWVMIAGFMLAPLLLGVAVIIASMLVPYMLGYPPLPKPHDSAPASENPISD